MLRSAVPVLGLLSAAGVGLLARGATTRPAPRGEATSRIWLLAIEPSLVVRLMEARTVVAVADRSAGLLVEHRGFARLAFGKHNHRLVDADHVAAPPTPEPLIHEPQSVGARETVDFGVSPPALSGQTTYGVWTDLRLVTPRCHGRNRSGPGAP